MYIEYFSLSLYNEIYTYCFSETCTELYYKGQSKFMDKGDIKIS